MAAKPRSIDDVLSPGESVAFSYSCWGARSLRTNGGLKKRQPLHQFNGRIYFTSQRLIWISAVHEGGFLGWWHVHVSRRNRLRGTFDVPVSAIQDVQINANPFLRWVQTGVRVRTEHTVLVLFLGKLAQNRAAARAARFIQEVNPAVVVEKL